MRSEIRKKNLQFLQLVEFRERRGYLRQEIVVELSASKFPN